jgi:hypothetical protein
MVLLPQRDRSNSWCAICAGHSRNYVGETEPLSAIQVNAISGVLSQDEGAPGGQRDVEWKV